MNMKKIFFIKINGTWIIPNQCFAGFYHLAIRKFSWKVLTCKMFKIELFQEEDWLNFDAQYHEKDSKNVLPINAVL